MKGPVLVSQQSIFKKNQLYITSKRMHFLEMADKGKKTLEKRKHRGTQWDLNPWPLDHLASIVLLCYITYLKWTQMFWGNGVVVGEKHGREIPTFRDVRMTKKINGHVGEKNFAPRFWAIATFFIAILPLPQLGAKSLFIPVFPTPFPTPIFPGVDHVLVEFSTNRISSVGDGIAQVAFSLPTQPSRVRIWPLEKSNPSFSENLPF